MKAVRIPRADWQGFFDSLGRSRLGCYASVEVTTPEAGDQAGCMTRLCIHAPEPSTDPLSTC